MNNRNVYTIERYSLNKKDIWNSFIRESKNATFLFNRDYMDYHADRFVDHSLMLYRKGKIYALFPANIVNNVVYTHQGLTYGGLLMSKKTTLKDVEIFFSLINNYYKEKGFRKVVYKVIPYIYSNIPSQEDLYVLFAMCRARIIGRNISSTIYQNNQLPFEESRRSGLRKAQKHSLIIRESTDYSSFWNILNTNLQEKYGVNAVHSLSEIELLQRRFPNNIKLYLVYLEDSITPVGGSVLYLTTQVCHTQYISATSYGKSIGALDFLFDYLIHDKYKEYQIFDFGQSTEEMGKFLNKSLLFQKEGFGGRGVCYDVYEYDL